MEGAPGRQLVDEVEVRVGRLDLVLRLGAGLGRGRRVEASSAIREARQCLSCSKREPSAGRLYFQTAKLKTMTGIAKECGVEMRNEKVRGREKEREA